MQRSNITTIATMGISSDAYASALSAVSYCHLSRVTLKEKTPVLAGDVVGITGNTGRSTGEHLHITCKRSGISINPFIILKYIRNKKRDSELAISFQFLSS